VTTTRLQDEWLGDSFTSIRMLRKTASSHLWLKRDIIGATEGSFFWEDPPKMGPIGKGFLGNDIRERVCAFVCRAPPGHWPGGFPRRQGSSLARDRWPPVPLVDRWAGELRL
jgi:hypothetical protein